MKSPIVLKAVMAAGGLALLAVLVTSERLGAVAIARILLCLSGIAVAGALLAKLKGQGTAEKSDGRRLEVISSSALSARCSVALVEAEGSTYLIAFGDSFAQIHPTDGASQARDYPRSLLQGLQ